MSQNNDAPKKTLPPDSPASEVKHGGGGWRDPARRRSFNLGPRGKYPAAPPVKS